MTLKLIGQGFLRRRTGTTSLLGISGFSWITIPFKRAVILAFNFFPFLTTALENQCHMFARQWRKACIYVESLIDKCPHSLLAPSNPKESRIWFSYISIWYKPLLPRPDLGHGR